jgi:uncharacterized membrane protein YdjX (TVP38/TMEM64 family)
MATLWKMAKPSKPEVLLAGILGIGPLVGLLLGGALVASARSWPHEWGYDILLWSILAVGMFLGVVPSSLAALSVALRWGWEGFLPYLATMTICATVFFLLVRRHAASSLRERIERNAKLSSFARALDQRAFALLLAVRLAPVLVYSWTNALFALSGLGLSRYVLGTFFGAIPRVAAGFAAGRAGLSIFQEFRKGLVPDGAAWWVLGGGVAAIVVLGLLGKAWIESMRGKADGAPRGS